MHRARYGGGKGFPCLGASSSQHPEVFTNQRSPKIIRGFSGGSMTQPQLRKLLAVGD